MKPCINYALRVALGTSGFAAMAKFTQFSDLAKGHPAIHCLTLIMFGVPNLIYWACSAASWITYDVKIGRLGGVLVFMVYFAILFLPSLFWLRSGNAAWKWLQRALLAVHLLVGVVLADCLL